MKREDLDSSLSETNTYADMALTSGFHQPVVIPKPSLVEAQQDINKVIEYSSLNDELRAYQISQLLSYIQVLEAKMEQLTNKVSNHHSQQTDQLHEFNKDLGVLAKDRLDINENFHEVSRRLDILDAAFGDSPIIPNNEVDDDFDDQPPSPIQTQGHMDKQMLSSPGTIPWVEDNATKQSSGQIMTQMSSGAKRVRVPPNPTSSDSMSSTVQLVATGETVLIESKYLITKAPIILNLSTRLMLQASDNTSVPSIDDKKVKSMTDVDWLQWLVNYVHYNNVSNVPRELASYLSIDVMKIMCGFMDGATVGSTDRVMDVGSLNKMLPSDIVQRLLSLFYIPPSDNLAETMALLTANKLFSVVGKPMFTSVNIWWTKILDIIGTRPFNKQMMKEMLKSIKCNNWSTQLEPLTISWSSWIDLHTAISKLCTSYDNCLQIIERNTFRKHNPNPTNAIIKEGAKLKLNNTPLIEDITDSTQVQNCLACNKTGHFAVSISGKTWKCPTVTDPAIQKRLMAAQVVRYAQLQANRKKKSVKAITASEDSNDDILSSVLEVHLTFKGLSTVFTVGLDTQSCTSIMPRDIYDQWFANYRLSLLPSNAGITDVQSNDIPMHGYIALSINSISSLKGNFINHNDKKIFFIVADVPSDNILIGCNDMGRDKLNILRHIDLLFIQNESEPSHQIKKTKVALSDAQFKALEQLHNDFVGHVGIQRLYAMAKDTYPDHNFTVDQVDSFIKTCHTCQKRLSRPYGISPFSLDKGLAHQVFVDVFTVNKLIFLVALYGPTDFLMVVELFSYEAVDTVLGLIQLNSILNFRNVHIKPDPGTNFTAQVTQELAAMSNSEISFGIAASHQSHAYAERAQGIMLYHMSPVIARLKVKYPSETSTRIGVFQSVHIHNALPRNGLGGYTPSQLTYPLHDGDLKIFDAPSSNHPLLHQLVNIQQDMLAVVLEIQKKQQRKHQSSDPFPGSDIHKLIRGDLVLVIHDSVEILPKVAYDKTGPFVFISYDPKTQGVTVQSLISTGNTFVVHSRRVCPFNYDSRFNITPVDIAGLDTSSSFVKELVEHTGDPKHRKDMRFLLRWGNDVTTWESWDKVKSLEALDTYIMSKSPALNSLKTRSKKIASIHAVGVVYSPVLDNAYMLKPDGLLVHDFNNNLSQVSYGGTLEEKRIFQEIVSSYAEVFGPIKSGGFCTAPKVNVHLKPGYDPNSLFRQQFPITDLRKKEAIIALQDKLISTGRLEPCPTPNPKACSPMFGVIDGYEDNGDAIIRGVVDLIHINKAVVIKPLYSVKDPETIFNNISKPYISQFDWTMSFYQCQLDENARELFVIQLLKDLSFWQFTGLPMGFVNSSKELQSIQESIFNQSGQEIYADGIFIATDTFEQHAALLKLTLQQAKDHNVKFKAVKAFINTPDQVMIGRKINSKYRTIDDKSANRIRNMELPLTKAQLMTALGFFNWVRNYTLDYSRVAAPLYQMQTQCGKRLTWTELELNAWEQLLTAASTPLRLFKIVLFLNTYVISDACERGWMLFIYQIEGDDDLDNPINGILDFNNTDFSSYHIIAMDTGSWNSTQRRWKTIEQECYAFYAGITSNEHLLAGLKFNLFTDHQNLVYLKTPSSNKVYRWMVALQAFLMVVLHTPGSKNTLCDAGSRVVVRDTT